MLGDVNKLFVFISLLTMPSDVLPLHLKQIFLPIIWIFTEGEGDGIESRLPFKIFSILLTCAFECLWCHLFDIPIFQQNCPCKVFWSIPWPFPWYSWGNQLHLFPSEWCCKFSWDQCLWRKELWIRNYQSIEFGNQQTFLNLSLYR